MTETNGEIKNEIAIDNKVSFDLNNKSTFRTGIINLNNIEEFKAENIVSNATSEAYDFTANLSSEFINKRFGFSLNNDYDLSNLYEVSRCSINTKEVTKSNDNYSGFHYGLINKFDSYSADDNTLCFRINLRIITKSSCKTVSNVDDTLKSTCTSKYFGPDTELIDSNESFVLDENTLIKGYDENNKSFSGSDNCDSIINIDILLKKD